MTSSMPQAIRVSTINFIIKLVLFSIVFTVEAGLFPQLHLSQITILAIAVALTFVGTIADLVIVPPLGNLPALSLGWFGMTMIIWAITNLTPTAQVSLVDAWFMSIPLGPIEFFLHRYVLDSLFH